MMYGKLLLQVLALCVVWHKQGDGVTTAFMAPQPVTAPNRAPLELNSYALARWGVSDGPGYSPSIANELIRGFDRWDDFGYGYGRGNDYGYGLSYGGYGRNGGYGYGRNGGYGYGRNNRIPWYCDNDLSSTEYHNDHYYNGSNRGYYDGGYNRGYFGMNNNYYGGRGNYGYGGGYGYDRNRYSRNGYY